MRNVQRSEVSVEGKKFSVQGSKFFAVVSLPAFSLLTSYSLLFTVYYSLFYFLLITAAAYPAPNPLSMLTTVTPDAQEFSMPRRAAIPPKLAP